MSLFLLSYDPINICRISTWKTSVSVEIDLEIICFLLPSCTFVWISSNKSVAQLKRGHCEKCLRSLFEKSVFFPLLLWSGTGPGVFSYSILCILKF